MFGYITKREKPDSLMAQGHILAHSNESEFYNRIHNKITSNASDEF